MKRERDSLDEYYSSDDFSRIRNLKLMLERLYEAYSKRHLETITSPSAILFTLRRIVALINPLMSISLSVTSQTIAQSTTYEGFKYHPQLYHRQTS